LLTLNADLLTHPAPLCPPFCHLSPPPTHTPSPRPQDPEARKALVAELHKLKTDLFMGLVESGAMPLRPGVQRLVQEALAAGEGD